MPISDRRLIVRTGLRREAGFTLVELLVVIAMITILAAMAGTVATCFFLSKAYAPITLFILGLAAATVLGFPFRGVQPIPTGSPAPGDSTGTRKGQRRR